MYALDPNQPDNKVLEMLEKFGFMELERYNMINQDKKKKIINKKIMTKNF